MKKLLVATVAIFVVSFANAQEKKSFKKGDVILGGTIEVDNTSSKGSSSTSIGIAPEVYYFLDGKTAVGGSLGIETKSIGDKTETGFGLKAGVRRYLWEVKGFSVYGEADVHFVTVSNTNTFGIQAGLGVEYFLNKKWAVNFALADILSITSTSANDVSTTEVKLGVNKFNNPFAVPTFGVIYKF